MHGRPLIRLLLTFLLLFLLGAAVWRSTRAHSHSANVIQQETPLSTEVEIVLTASEPWEKCTLRYLDRTLVNAGPGESSQTQKMEFPLATSPADLVIDVSWKGKGNHALRLEAKARDISILDTTLWGDQTLQDVVTIPLQKAP